MPSKTICIREEIYKRLSRMKKKNESFSDLFNRILTAISEKDNNHDIIMNEVFGSAKDLPEEIFDLFAKLRKSIDEDFQVNIDSRI
ncbi:MAG: antitoxin VapB family protein [Candidatus Helarchaeota archaeon]